MKVATLTASIGPNAGGLFYSVRSLAKGLIEHGSHTEVFTLGEYTDEVREVWKPLQTHCYKTLPPRVYGYAPRLVRGLERFSPDLLHSHGIWMFTSCAARIASQRMGASVLVSPRGMLDPWALRNSSWKKRLVGNAIEYRFLRDVDCFHALNVSEARSIREFGVSKPICVIPNGTTLPDGVKVGSGLAEPKRRILFLGRIHPKKGIEDLLKAWALLKKDHNWMLTIAGWDDGGHLNAYRELTDQLGCADSVEWFGSAYGEVKDRLFRSSSAFILPSYSEGLPMSIIEAMSYGLLVLMTPECNIPEAFNAGAAIKIETGYCGIQAGLDQMLAMSDAELIGLGGAGRLLVEKSFTWDQQVLRMQGVYDWMLGNADEPDCMFDG